MATSIIGKGGMGNAVVEVIKACLPCVRVKASFRESDKELQPLPIQGLGYRWGGKLCWTLRDNICRQLLGDGLHRTLH